ncbi:zinc finger protein [Anaeramoeba flamelloides]|uniref:Zinc finger protein n=1 Tax=Anaeramoeba flamelloides TaxID=1746091 RepID=A0ABQ8XQY5_9EUKA|nr:zinc finger protein [Anaeramoeba flamelloides]
MSNDSAYVDPSESKSNQNAQIQPVSQLPQTVPNNTVNQTPLYTRPKRRTRSQTRSLYRSQLQAGIPIVNTLQALPVYDPIETRTETVKGKGRGRGRGKGRGKGKGKGKGRGRGRGKGRGKGRGRGRGRGRGKPKVSEKTIINTNIPQTGQQINQQLPQQQQQQQQPFVVQQQPQQQQFIQPQQIPQQQNVNIRTQTRTRNKGKRSDGRVKRKRKNLQGIVSDSSSDSDQGVPYRDGVYDSGSEYSESDEERNDEFINQIQKAHKQLMTMKKQNKLENLNQQEQLRKRFSTKVISVAQKFLNYPDLKHDFLSKFLQERKKKRSENRINKSDLSIISPSLNLNFLRQQHMNFSDLNQQEISKRIQQIVISQSMEPPSENVILLISMALENKLTEMLEWLIQISRCRNEVTKDYFSTQELDNTEKQLKRIENIEIEQEKLLLQKNNSKPGLNENENKEVKDPLIGNENEIILDENIFSINNSENMKIEKDNNNNSDNNFNENQQQQLQQTQLQQQQQQQQQITVESEQSGQVQQQEQQQQIIPQQPQQQQQIIQQQPQQQPQQQQQQNQEPIEEKKMEIELEPNDEQQQQKVELTQQQIIQQQQQKLEEEERLKKQQQLEEKEKLLLQEKKNKLRLEQQKKKEIWEKRYLESLNFYRSQLPEQNYPILVEDLEKRIKLTQQRILYGQNSLLSIQDPNKKQIYSNKLLELETKFKQKQNLLFRIKSQKKLNNPIGTTNIKEKIEMISSKFQGSNQQITAEQSMWRPIVPSLQIHKSLSPKMFIQENVTRDIVANDMTKRNLALKDLIFYMENDKYLKKSELLQKIYSGMYSENEEN